MSKFIIGTAGHIDHGKTSLIRALTGRNTDKLEEEQRRGISINLGFTYFDLPSKERCGIVDVPGHERFIKNMIAGAVGIDLCLLVVSAQEGVMPQTIEHIEILSHLNLENSLIVFSKCDLVDDEDLELIIEDVYEKLKDTLFEKAEYIKVDSISGRGIPELIEKLDNFANAIKDKPVNLPARLNIDRSFTLKGLGTVVTGTLSEGSIKVNEEIFLYPQNIKVKPRSIQVHEENVNEAFAGQRTAINLTGIRKEEVKRGDVLAFENSLVYTDMADVKITVSKSYKEIKMWDRVRVYVGTKEVLARVVPINQNVIKSGESGYCQLRFEEGVYVKKDDPFVLRLFSPLVTIGGGVVLTVNATKHKNINEVEYSRLINMEEKSENSQLLDVLKNNAKETVSIGKLLTLLSISKEIAEKEVDDLINSKYVVKINEFYLHIDTYNDYVEDVILALNDFHCNNPLKVGMNKEEIRNVVKTPYKLKDFSQLLCIMEEENIIKSTKGLYSLLNFQMSYTKEQLSIKEKIENSLFELGFAPLKIDEILPLNKNTQEVLESILDISIVRIDKDIYIHMEYINKSKKIIEEFVNKNGNITLADFRNITNSSRKYSLMLLDYFDNAKYTKRVGDNRILY
ncbi:MAG: selenocysteine-specific translation elongation factor [Lachnospirales bacterium]